MNKRMLAIFLIMVTFVGQILLIAWLHFVIDKQQQVINKCKSVMTPIQKLAVGFKIPESEATEFVMGTWENYKNYWGE